jgi:GDP-mannose 4,6-dehydratase
LANRRVLITGLTGFVGSHLAEHLLEHEPSTTITGFRRWRSPIDNVRKLLDEPRINWVSGDLLDESSVRNLVREADADYIFHLAAQSYVPFSYRAPRATLEANAVGTSNLLEALRAHRDETGKDPFINVCSSSEVYGQPREDEVPINESNPLRPISPYGISKVAQDLLGQQAFHSYGLKTLITRMFTHTGPRRGDVFVLAAFARQVVRIEKRLQEPVVRVGNLDSVRTFADVRDAVNAYRLLVQICQPGEVYNIGGDRTMTVGEMLDLMIERSALETAPEIKQDPALFRPSDVTLQIPDCSKFIAETGWTPVVPFEKTIDDTLAHLRTEL